MPKSVQPEEQPTDDDVVITDDSAGVTKLPAKKASRATGKHQATPEPAEQEQPPAPRTKLRESLLAATKRVKPRQRSRTKNADHSIWHRGDEPASFDHQPRAAREFSGRTVALLTVLFIATIIMAQPLQLLLEQQSDIAQAKQQLSQEQTRQQNLETQLDRWEDPAYVQQQARERFNMVMPGERKYVVIDDEQNTTPQEPVADPFIEDIEIGWADRLWGSIKTSGQE